MMRIIAGTFKGRRLRAPKGARPVRPTADRVKESVFSILRDRIVDADVLDLCAGTGNIGIEALSRGAKHVTFVERDPWCIKLIEANLSTCGLQGGADSRWTLRRGDAVKAVTVLGKRAATFKVIYFDPPYDAGSLYATCLAGLSESAVLCRGGVLLVEHARRCAMPETVGDLNRRRSARYGDTVVSFYEKNVL